MEMAVRLAIQVLEALNYAHQQGVIPRDVKPSNILLGDDGAYLSDFGVVQLMGNARGLTADSSGTIAYMSPEQIQRPRDVDQRSDVYGFGCVLYEMLTGRQPFGGNSDDETKYLQDGVAPIAAGKAVGLLFVPFVNFFWLATAYLRLPREYNAYAERHCLAPRLSSWVFYLYCITMWVSFFLLRTTRTAEPIA